MDAGLQEGSHLAGGVHEAPAGQSARVGHDGVEVGERDVEVDNLAVGRQLRLRMHKNTSPCQSISLYFHMPQ